jgi:hypothetical protein
VETELWLNSYIKDLIISNSSNDELLSKALGEFSLYCFFLKRNNCLDSTNKEILTSIFNKYVNLNHLSYFTFYCLDKDYSNLNYTLDTKCLELFYINSFFFKKEMDWNSYYYDYIKDINEKGITIDNTYFLTHIIYYSEDFGLSSLSLNGKLLIIIKNILELSETKFRNLHNWDVLREIYLSRCIIDESYNKKVYKLIEDENKFIKSKFGWYLSDGKNIEYYEKNYNLLSSRQKYSLFHTTLVSKLLEKSLFLNII